MKKIFYVLCGAVMALAAGACCGKGDNAGASGGEGEVIVSPKAGADGIVTLTEGDYYTPGKPVDRLTIIDFGAVWCGPCRQFKPVFHEAAKKFEGKATFVAVDIDSLPQMMSDFELEAAVPTVLFIRPDGSRTSYLGTADLMPYEKFAALIEQQLEMK